MISLALVMAGVLLLGVAVTAFAAGRIAKRAFFALLAGANGLTLLSAVISHNQFGASINAASLAFAVYGWWQGGGGDDTKRRLRRWTRKFHGVRRTAPAAGAA